MNLPEDLTRNPHFVRYYRTWEKNRVSVVFIPLAQICREQGFLEEAREICERGLREHPHSVSGRLLLARIYFDLDQNEKAGGILAEILSDWPGQREATSLLERIKRCGGVTKKDPVQSDVKRSASLWENITMAKIYADQGEAQIARQMVQRILTRDPVNEKALQLLKEWTK